MLVQFKSTLMHIICQMTHDNMVIIIVIQSCRKVFDGEAESNFQQYWKEIWRKAVRTNTKKNNNNKKNPTKANKIFAKHLAGAPMGSINAYWYNYCAPCNLNSTKTTIFSKRLFDCFCNNVFIPNEANL